MASILPPTCNVIHRNIDPTLNTQCTRWCNQNERYNQTCICKMHAYAHKFTRATLLVYTMSRLSMLLRTMILEPESPMRSRIVHICRVFQAFELWTKWHTKGEKGTELLIYTFFPFEWRWRYRGGFRFQRYSGL